MKEVMCVYTYVYEHVFMHKHDPVIILECQGKNCRNN